LHGLGQGAEAAADGLARLAGGPYRRFLVQGLVRGDMMRRACRRPSYAAAGAGSRTVEGAVMFTVFWSVVAGCDWHELRPVHRLRARSCMGLGRGRPSRQRAPRAVFDLWSRSGALRSSARVAVVAVERLFSKSPYMKNH
jgi:hypothetical protein